MNRVGETGAISLSFLTGIIASLLAGHPTAVASASAAAAALFLTLSIVKSGRCTLWIMLTFVCTGALCHSADVLSSSFLPDSPTAGRLSVMALENFKNLIAGCGFRGEHTGALIKALLTGCRDELGRDTIQKFRESGASHILALSGLHLGVIYAILSKSLAFLGNGPAGRTVKSGLTVICCGFYTLMTGSSDSTVRAFIFISVNETVRSCSSREKKSENTLFLALIIQLVLRPSRIASPGLQLSYLAMLGIMTVYPMLEGWYPTRGKKVTDRLDLMRRIWSSAALSISCQLFTSPVAWWHFRSLPSHFMLTNLLALPLTELLISSAVTTIILNAAGICPECLTRLTDFLAETLEFCIGTIATM